MLIISECLCSCFMCRVYPASLSMVEENGCRNVNNATIFTHLETQSVSVLPNMSNYCELIYFTFITKVVVILKLWLSESYQCTLYTPQWQSKARLPGLFVNLLLLLILWPLKLLHWSDNVVLTALLTETQLWTFLQQNPYCDKGFSCASVQNKTYISVFSIKSKRWDIKGTFT